MDKQAANRFKSKLSDQRNRIRRIEQDLEDEALIGLTEDATDEISHVRMHPGDLGTNEMGQDIGLTVAENEIGELQDIDEALMRIQNETYGVCQECGREIPVARLEAVPYTRYCVDCERRLEKAARVRNKQ